MEGQITLFDLPSATEKKCWSFNTWKTRFVLNYKSLPYKTEWVEYPDLKSVLGSLNIPKTGKSGTFQSVPAILDGIHESGKEAGPPTPVADSYDIARYLDTKYPGPLSLFPNGTASLHKLMITHIQEHIAMCTQTLLIPQTYVHLNPYAKPYFRETRQADMCSDEFPTLESLCPKGPLREALIEDLRVALDKLDAMFPETRGRESEGIFTIPSQIVFSDFALASILMWFKVLAHDELWVHVELFNGGRWAKLLNALDQKYGQVI